VLTLIVDHDLDLAVLHDTNTRVGSAKIDTNNRSRNASRVVVLEGSLVLSAGGPRHHQTAHEDEEKVERHCGVVWVWAKNNGTVFLLVKSARVVWWSKQRLRVSQEKREEDN
jgi:hypothetical protein